MWPDRVSNPGPLTYESGALPTALRGLAPLLEKDRSISNVGDCLQCFFSNTLTLLHSEPPKLYGVLAILGAIGLMSTLQLYTAQEKEMHHNFWQSLKLLKIFIPLNFFH